MLANHLEKGDTVGVIAISSPPHVEQLHKGIPYLESMGLHVKLGKHVFDKHKYLAGTDEARLSDFHEMIKDPNIKAIFFACGGYGSARLVSKIDYEAVRQNPKIIWGFSDLTYLHTAIREETRLVTFHGPMIASDLGNGIHDQEVTLQGFSQLFGPTLREYNEAISPLEVITAGEASGELVGGNLTLLTSTMGTPYEIDTLDKILFIEDINEEPYKIDYKLQQLKYAGKLAQCRGIVVGDFAKAEPKTDRPAFTLPEIFEFYLGDLNIPVVTGFKMGHCSPHFAVPLGITARLSADERRLRINPAVK